MGMFSGGPGQKGPRDKSVKDKCPKCGLVFSNKDALDRHQKRTDSLRCGADRG